MMFEEGEYYSPSEMMFSCINSTMSNSRKKKKMMNKRRFSDEQVRSLESIFENETKLEPKKKVQLARELELQPRQVAIWFQNKRARYKSKQLERDYSILRANYNALASQFESLKNEKNTLLMQVQKLRDLAGKGTEEGDEKQLHEEEGGEANMKKADEGTQIINTHELSDDRDHDEGKQELSMEGAGSEHGACSIISDEGSSEIENTKYNNLDEMDQIMNAVDPTVVEANCNWDDDLRSDGLFDDIDQPVDNCQWWDFCS